MNSQSISLITEILVGRFNHLGPDNFNLDRELETQKDPFTDRALTDSEKAEIERRVLDVIRYRRSHDGAVLVPISVVADEREHEEWYDDWLLENDNETEFYYWKRLEHHLSVVLTHKYGPDRAGRIVRSIDEATYGILKKLANPQRTAFNYKGLVVGYVQSGKTANFSALIAKAADAGYKFIIVLSGIHNILRRQTQIRLDKELTGMNDRGIDETFISEPSDAKRWNRLSSARLENDGEFSPINLDPFTSFCRRSTPTIAIIKKNCRVMNRLIEYIGQAEGDNLAQMPLLIIDDEADQASIDTNANDPDTEPSRTNESIRSILSLFPRKAYIGYTATPFANVLINMTAEHDHLEDDLYPRNFIVSLPEPEGYFGTSAIFQGNLSEYFVRETPDERETLVMDGQMTENLARAIDEFIICCAIRNIRGNRQKPMTMLIHVSHKIVDMGTVRGLVDDYFNGIRERIRDRDGELRLRNEYDQIWRDFITDSQLINEELDLDNRLPEFGEIWSEISIVLPVIRIVELNVSSDDVLDYTTGEEIKVIAIGGNQLSRGLTLEGLMTSYYLRPSRQYDTLLQMARWFGYRMGYEDLTSVHTTTTMWDDFEHLALVEEEMRSEIYRYEEENRTPAEMAIAIRDHRRLNVTAPNKMGAATTRQISYSESLNQTIWFPLDSPEILRANYNLGDRFISNINAEFGFELRDSLYLAQNIPGELVLRNFLYRYSFADRESTGGPGLDYERLLAYIFRRLNDQNPELQNWSVSLVGNLNPLSGSDDPVTYGGMSLNRIRRSRKHTERGYNIGVLTEPDHLRVDLFENAESPYDGRSPQNPLLLLYLIWRGSTARVYIENPGYDQRIDLYRYLDSDQVDVLGLAVVLPRSDYEPYNYIGQ